jgi:predicted unusual protein kinase regulating ubiquinone biosynthesis (AarF/ABC1/UbiB family)
VFYDFGMSGRVDPFIQEKIVDFYAAVADQDIDAILDSLIEMGTLSPEADRQVMAEVMELAIADARGEDIEQYRVQQIIQQVEDTIYEFPLRLPSNLALVLRVATVVEGVCVTLDPDFDFIAVATDYLRESGYFEEGARQYIQDRADDFQAAAQSSLRIPPKLEDTLDRIDRDALTVQAELEDANGLFDVLAARIVYALLLASGIVSTVLLYGLSAPSGARIVAVLGTVVVGVLLYLSFRKRRGIRAKPQFTRQEMRKRQTMDDEAATTPDLGFDTSADDSDDSSTGTQPTEIQP